MRARFIALVGLFLYWSFLATRVGQPIDSEQLSALFYAINQYFGKLQGRMKRKRNHVLFVLPLLLLSLRVAVNTLFSFSYPKWTTTVDGQQLLKQMDRLLLQLF